MSIVSIQGRLRVKLEYIFVLAEMPGIARAGWLQKYPALFRWAKETGRCGEQKHVPEATAR
jgi:hypothetical protein